MLIIYKMCFLVIYIIYNMHVFVPIYKFVEPTWNGNLQTSIFFFLNKYSLHYDKGKVQSTRAAGEGKDDKAAFAIESA